MSDLINIAIVLLAGVIQATLQLSFGALVLLYHSSLSKHRRRTTKSLTRSYIFGSAVMSFLAVGCLAFLFLNILKSNFRVEFLLTVLTGVLLISSVIMWRVYFRKNKRKNESTELWIPRSFARFIRKRAKKTDDAIEAFSLGCVSTFVEMPISFALYAVAAFAIVNSSIVMQFVGLFAYTLISVLPLIILKLHIRNGRNVVEVQRWRVANKTFLKNISGAGFITLAISILSFWVLK